MAKARAAYHKNTVNNAANEFARTHLRPSSGIPSQKKSYVERKEEVFRKDRFLSATSPSHEDEKVESRLFALQEVLQRPRPTRFDVARWKKYRQHTVDFLAEYYPNTDLAKLCTWIEENGRPEGKAPLSAARIFLAMQEMFSETEISSDFEMRKLMKALAFGFLHIHSSYYFKISIRPDVCLHRKMLIPMLLFAQTHPRSFFVNFDFSFVYQNEFSPSAWVSLAMQNADLVDAKPGKGPRMSICEFITRYGILQHPDGRSAGQTFMENEIITAEIVKDCIKRGCEAIVAHPLVKSGAQPFLLIDNARVQTTKPPNFINPRDMNVSDGGKNRVEMNLIGLRGIRSVLEEHGRWKEGMLADEARSVLWKSKMVQSQMTEVEGICRNFGVVLLYNCKAHPWLAMIEQYWRWLKKDLMDLLSIKQIQEKHLQLVDIMMSGSLEAKSRCEKWFSRSLKYTKYYACGGLDVVRAREMEHLDLDSLGPSVARARFSSFEEMTNEAHDANWIAICGKRYEAVAEYWE